MKMATKNSVLSNITRKLKAGDVTKLVDTTGYSQPHVSNVLAGRRTNNTILKAAEKLTRRRK